MKKREAPVIEADLERVRWLLDEVSAWDESLAPRSARTAIAEYYGRQEDTLVAALAPPPPPPSPIPSPSLSPSPRGGEGMPIPVQSEPSPGPEAETTEDSAPVQPERSRGPEAETTEDSAPVQPERSRGPASPPAPPPQPLPPPPPPGPSRWQLTWKPFLTESLGWFLGAFLILSGALYLVADAWAGMTSTLRALTVFGLVEAWAVGFAAWAAALSRKDSTRAASVGLRRIAALVAPLAVLALGPALDSVFSWLALLGGTAVAGFLGLRAAKDLEEPDALLLTASISLATLGLGLVPVLPVAGGWLVLVPAALAVLAFRRGPRETPARTTVAVLAFVLPVAALVARLVVSPLHLQSALAATWVACAALASGALWLRDPKAQKNGALTVVAMSVFLVALLASFVSVAPACVLIAVLGVWTTWRLSKEASSPEDRRAWWLAGTFVFAYLTWQRFDQLVPAIVWTWWDALKVMLGYAAAPMPASYGSVYQALFIAVGTVVAGWKLRTSPRAAHIWLRCSAIAGVAAGALAMVSVNFDARPAVVALPLLALPLLGVGVWRRREDALAAGSVLAVFFALALGLTVMPGWPAAVVALALALGAHALPVAKETRVLRRWLASAGLGGGAVAFLLAAGTASPLALATLVLGVAACLLAARALNRQVLMLASFSALIPLAHCESPLLFGVAAAIGGGLLFVRGRRWGATVPALASMALIAPVWSLAMLGHTTAPVQLNAVLALAAAGGLAAVPLRRWWWVASLAGGALLALVLPSMAVHLAGGVPWLASAVALGLLSRRVHPRHRGWLEAPAILTLVVAISPPFGLWSGFDALPLVCSGALALGASIHAVRRRSGAVPAKLGQAAGAQRTMRRGETTQEYGRSWQGIMLATLCVFSALLSLEQGRALLIPMATVVLLATPALLASVTVPLAALLLGGAFFGQPVVLLGISIVTALLALLEESELAWRTVLNRASLTWAATITSALALLMSMLVADHAFPMLVPALLLPLVWARATRRGEVLAAGIAFTALAGPWWCAPLVAIAAGRLLQLGAVRRALGLASAALEQRRALEGMVLFGAAALVGASSVAVDPSHAVPWFAALLLMGGPFLAMRVVVACALAVPFAPLRAPAVGTLVALGAAAHHLPAQLKRLLGGRTVRYVEPVALLLAMAGAASLAFLEPAPGALSALLLSLTTVGALVGVRATAGSTRRALTGLACVALGGTVAVLAPQWMMPVTVLVAAVLLGVPALIPVAIVAAGLTLPASLASLTPVLAPHLFVVALAAAVGAVALRWTRFSEPVDALWRWLGREPEGGLAAPLFWGALALGALLLAHGELQALWLAPLLLVSPQRREAGPAFAFAALAVATLLDASVSVPLTCAAALGFAYAGAQFSALRVSLVWRHASWLLALLAMGLAGIDLTSPLIPLAWSAGAAVTWLLLREREGAKGWAWAATGVALHVVMAFVGVVLSTGAPKVLIFPWWAAASASLALLRQLRGGRASVLAFGSVALAELLLGTSLLASAQPREAVLSVLVAGVLAFIAWRRVVEEDEQASAWLGQGALVSGALAVRVLGMGALPDLTDAWVLLGVSALFAGLSQFLRREGRTASASALELGALGWPMVGALLVPWHTWSLSAAWLLGLSVVAAWMARAGSKRSGSLLSALALNGAVVLAALGSGFGELQLLRIPLGLTLLVLARVFHTELSAGAGVKLRAWGMGLMYVAVAWKPLTVTAVPALVLCVVVCLGGVALGALWRIRSYVVLGSGVLVTTVLATLVRSGLAEPRLGAVFLSLLGLTVVVVMVMITTKREELQARLAAMQRVMASWEA